KIASVERDELRLQILNLIHESCDQFLFGPVANMRRTECIYLPVSLLATCHQSTDADDGVIDVLGKLTSNRLPDLVVSFAVKPVGCGETLEIRDGLNVPDNYGRHLTIPSVEWSAQFTNVRIVSERIRLPRLPRRGSGR